MDTPKVGRCYAPARARLADCLADWLAGFKEEWSFKLGGALYGGAGGVCSVPLPNLLQLYFIFWTAPWRCHSLHSLGHF